MKNKAVLVVSFGTSYPDVLNNSIKVVENKIHEVLPDFELRRAFTSDFIIRKLAKRDGMVVDNPEGALNNLEKEGFTDVVVQPLHIIPGYEYQKVKDTVVEFINKGTFDSLLLGEPLLYNNEDYVAVVEALKVHIPLTDDGMACILMGHGTSHFSNACYYCLQSYMHKSNLNAYIANVEGVPSLDAIISELKRKGIKKVLLMPFMLVAGEHVKNDMAGKENSWKTILENKGFKVEVHMHGLGEKEEFRQIFVQKALKAAGLIKADI